MPDNPTRVNAQTGTAAPSDRPIRDREPQGAPTQAPSPGGGRHTRPYPHPPAPARVTGAIGAGRAPSPQDASRPEAAVAQAPARKQPGS
ncbi:hypothetical protein AA103196_1294 [Ameyamaea chiangmaiensis NBRC 103196]|nr:hypothetical protein AA103196_1294 [Ameyamaea chiangmaiensis NBRC 103196]